MKKIVLTLMLFCSLAAVANDSIPAIILDMQTRVSVSQSDEISGVMMDLINGVEREVVDVQGFRVQVYSSSNQKIASSESSEIEQLLKDKGISDVYREFQSPFWKVRIGNFRTQEEAAKMKEIIREKFPELAAETYVVRALIQVVE